MATITLDITGFYFAKTFCDEQGDMFVGKTVADLTNMTKGMTGDSNRGRLTEVQFDQYGFLQTLAVDFNGTDIPKSRQINFDGSAPTFKMNPPVGVYGYTDNLGNAVQGQDITFTPAWQYYHFDSFGKLRSGAGAGTVRTIVPATKSDQVAPLADGDRVVWRLVLIGGIRERLMMNPAAVANMMGPNAPTAIGALRNAV